MKYIFTITIASLLFLSFSCAANIQSKYDRTIEYYSNKIATNLNDTESYYNRGRAYYLKGQRDQAIEDCNKAIAINPNLINAYILRGLAYEIKGQYDKAMQDYNKAIAINPKDALVQFAYNNRGILYGKIGKYDQAIEDFNKAIAIKPDYADAYFNRGLAYHEKGFEEKAMADAQKACDLGIENACKVISSANIDKILKMSGNSVVSILKYNNIGNLAARGSGFVARQDGVIITNYHVISNAANIRIRIKNDTFAVQGVIHIDKENDIAILKIEAKGLEILKLGDIKNAVVGEKVYAISNPDGNKNLASEGIFRAIRETPSKKKALMTTATVSRGSSGGPLLNKNGETIGIITYTMEGAGAVAMPVNHIKDKISSKMVILLKDAKIEDDANYAYLVNSCSYADDYSIESCTKALAINSNNAELYYNRGVAYKRKGQYDRAIEDFNKAIIITPNFAEAYNNRGIAYEMKGQDDRAIEDYNKALGIDSNNAAIYYNRGIAYLKKGRNDRAMDDINNAIAIEPYSIIEAYNDRGLLYVKKGQFDKAIEDFNRVILKNPNYANPYFGRGLAFIGKGQYDQAIEDFNKSIIINPNFAKAYIGRGEAYLMMGLRRNAISDFRKACDMGDELGCEGLQRVLKKQ